MTLDRRAIRAAALEQMQTATPRPLYEGLLYTLCSAALLFLAGQIFSFRLELDDLYQYLSYFNAENINTISYAQALKLVEKMQPTTTEYLFSMGLQLFQSFVSAGFSLFALRSLRREETCSLWNLFDSFGVFLPLLLVLILKRLLLTLWLQLLIIPGLIAFYRYRLAVYLVLDHPRLGGFRAILLSSGLMRGHKGQLLLLDLSFAGWFFLSMLPYSLSVLTQSLPVQILGALGSAALYAALATYHRLSCTIFYQQLCQDLEQKFEKVE